MTLIFTSVPKFLDFFLIFLKKFNLEVYYLKLNEFNNENNNNLDRSNKLKKHNILPLPADTIKKYIYPYFKKGISINYQKKFDKLLPKKIIKSLPKYFIKNKNLDKKIKIEFLSHISNYEGIDYVETWSNQFINKKIILVCFSLKYIFSRDINSKNNSCYKIIIPFNELYIFLIKLLKKIPNLFIKVLRNKNINKKEIYEKNYFDDQVSLVTHKGTTYSNLYHKDVYYSEDNKSIFNQKKLLHFDYSNIQKPKDNLKWINFENINYDKKKVYLKLFKMSFCTFIYVNTINNFFGWLYLILFYYRYLKFYERIFKFKNLKIALIDYDVLCPKSLILAFESRHIKTICVQDRFIAPLLEWHNFFYDYYLCSSNYVKQEIENSYSNNILIENIIPVGLYRTDYFKYPNKKNLPKILTSKNNFKKIVTCFGYHTGADWFSAQTSLLTNWKAHYQFLNDIYKLSQMNNNIYFVLRFKLIDWINIRYFKEIIEKIENAENIEISKDYSKFNISYDLASNSSLIIAKHTSLVEECLSYGLPVLIHDYTHNVSQTFLPSINYKPLDIYCNSYEELANKSKIILEKSPSEFMNENEKNLKNYFILSNKKNIKKNINNVLNDIYSSIENNHVN